MTVFASFFVHISSFIHSFILFLFSFSQFDLHSKAKLILSLSAMMGTRILLSEFEYVEGIPDLHLLFIGSIWSARHGLGREPKQKWFDVKENVRKM